MIRMVIMIDTDNQNANSEPTCAYFFQVSEMKAEYFPPKVEIILQNEIPTEFYVLVTGAVDVLVYRNGTKRVLSKLVSSDMAGEIGVVFNIPQPFTVRTRRLSQVIRLRHHTLKQMVQPHSEDGKKIISNFIQVETLVCLIA
nr:potassium channel KAT3-like [Populus alba]